MPRLKYLTIDSTIRQEKMVSESTGLKVIVVGAGIAGLAAARALREKHHVIIFEQSRMKNEVGAAIHMGPNASRILLGWGLSPKRVGSVYCYGVIERTYQNITQVDMETDSEKAFGSPWLLNHRADLHEELRRIALDPEGPGQVPELRLGCSVEKVDSESGTVTLADGSVVQGDVIIGADGIHSKVREAVLGKKMYGTPSGHSAYRLLIDAEKLKKDPDLAFLVKRGAITTFVGLDRRIVAYPCRNLTLLNIVAILPDKLLFEESKASWNVKGSIDDMLKSFEEFDPFIKRIFTYAGDCMLWQLRDQPPLESWTKGKAIIVGDAAHAMLPHQGQGGSQAIEDAEALGVALETATPGEVPEQLKKVEKVRYDRATFIQKCSREIAKGPGVDESGALGALNGNRFAQYINTYKGAREEFRKLEANGYVGNGPENGEKNGAV